MIAAIIQARMGSTRLPGKVLMPLAGVPVIDHVVARVRRASGLGPVAVATSRDASDDPLVAHLEAGGVPVVRGSLEDVLQRYLLAADRLGADAVLRITADCPLIEPALLSAMCARFTESAGDIDLLTNARQRSYPRGLDAEIAKLSALRAAAAAPDLECDDREHVTRYLYRHPQRFRIADVVGDADLSGHRWTLDEPADLELLSRIFEAWFEGREARAGDGPFLEDVLALLATRPDWMALNRDVRQKPGLPTPDSLRSDR